jgi:hypothetical protein
VAANGGSAAQRAGPARPAADDDDAAASGRSQGHAMRNAEHRRLDLPNFAVDDLERPVTGRGAPGTGR